MLIGKILQERMDLLEIEVSDLAIISSALHCAPEYFTSSAVRQRDLLLNIYKHNDPQVNQVAVRVQNCMNKFEFILSAREIPRE